MPTEILDYLVIGAGPAGLQLGQLFGAAGREYRILERASGPGSFFHTYPRHGRLISINKPHTGTTDPELNLRMDWNSLLSADPELLFTRYSRRYFPAAEDLVRYLNDFATRLRLNIAYNTRVELIRREADCFVLTDHNGQCHRGRRLVVATGVSQENTPAIPGIETAERYGTVSVDPEDFTDQRVLIIGKGNSALETADNLVETAAVIHVAGPRSIRFAWSSHYVGHLRAVNNNFLDTYQLKSQNALLDGEVQAIERRDGEYVVWFRFSRADEVVKQLRYDRVIVCTGFRFDASPFDPGSRPRLAVNGRFPALSSAYESVNVPDLYFAGTLMQERDFKKSTGGFIHGFRYAVRALSRILDSRYHATPWPSVAVGPVPSELVDAIISRVNRSSALWQQFGVLGDLLVIPGGGAAARYYEEVPVDFAHDTDFAGGDDYVTVTLEYGPDHDKVDPFDISVRRTAQNAADQAHDASYLHPVIRYFRRGKMHAVHHMAENLENRWDDALAHRRPLTDFLTRETTMATAPAGR